MKSAANYHPQLWGNCGWQFLHYVALGYSNKPTENDKEHYKKFMENIGYVLPCEECRINFQSHIKKYPIENYLDNSKKLFEWIIKIQNEVNRINHETKGLRKKFIDGDLMKKYYVNEQRRKELKNCCNLRAKSKKIMDKINKVMEAGP